MLSSPSFSAGNIIGGLLFSGIGYVAFKFGKDRERGNVMWLGVALMGYSYVMPSAAWTWTVGGLLTAGLVYFKD